MARELPIRLCQNMIRKLNVIIQLLGRVVSSAVRRSQSEYATKGAGQEMCEGVVIPFFLKYVESCVYLDVRSSTNAISVRERKQKIRANFSQSQWSRLSDKF